MRLDYKTSFDNDILPKPGLQFLALCYRFVTVDWQHASREDIPDQGFERRCRESCVTGLGSEWTVSQPREMQLGAGLDFRRAFLLDRKERYRKAAGLPPSHKSTSGQGNSVPEAVYATLSAER